MMTVKEFSLRTGVSIRTLHYYDAIGLLKPDEVTESGYRMYDDTSAQRLQQILLYRELGFSLKEIGSILDASGFDRERALSQQIEMLSLKKERMERLIAFARKLQSDGGYNMDFSVFDRKKLDEYAKEAKAQWGHTSAYREYEQRNADSTEEMQRFQAEGLMALFEEFGSMKEEDPSGEKARLQVRKLQAYISEHFYTCTDEILLGLAQMYAAGGEFTENIDRAGGTGTADFAARAIEAVCR